MDYTELMLLTAVICEAIEIRMFLKYIYSVGYQKTHATFFKKTKVY